MQLTYNPATIAPPLKVRERNGVALVILLRRSFVLLVPQSGCIWHFGGLLGPQAPPEGEHGVHYSVDDIKPRGIMAYPLPPCTARLLCADTLASGP